jgi:predicted DNA-binding transcriptional regulator YafY
MLDTSARLLKLLSILQGRPDWTGHELAERLGVTERTLRRDVVRLRDLGYPVQATPGAAGGYRLRAGATLPPLLLDDDEAVAVVLSLRTATSHTVTGIAETSLRALGKLERVLPPRLRQRMAALRDATEPLGDQLPTVDADVLTTIADACQSLHLLTFGYRGRDAAATTRTVEPHRLVHAGRRWYLVARDRDRDGWRTFRVDRIDAPHSTAVRFTPHDPPPAAAFVADSINTAQYRFRTRVVVRAPAHLVAERVPPTAGTVEPLDGERCLVTAGANSLSFIAIQFAALGHEFTVLEPPELLDELRTLADRLTRAAAASGTTAAAESADPA